MSLKRFAICDANGKVLNVTKMEVPLAALPFPGYGAVWVYVDNDDRPTDPQTIDNRVTYCAVKSDKPCGPGDTVNLSTGVVTPLVPPVPPPPTKDELRAYAAEKRWEKEVGGVRLNKFLIATDRDSQTKLIAEFVAMVAGIRQDPSVWKMADGEAFTLTNSEMQQVCIAARNHIANVFKKEADLIVEIERESVTTYEQISRAFEI